MKISVALFQWLEWLIVGSSRIGRSVHALQDMKTIPARDWAPVALLATPLANGSSNNLNQTSQPRGYVVVLTVEARRSASTI